MSLVSSQSPGWSSTYRDSLVALNQVIKRLPNVYGTNDLPEITTTTVIGITVAIAGNVLISLALNLQKLAHKRLETEKLTKARERLVEGQKKGKAASSHGGNGEIEGRRVNSPSLNEHDEDLERTHTDQLGDVFTERPARGAASSEAQPLIPFPGNGQTSRNYGVGSGASSSQAHGARLNSSKKTKRTMISRLLPLRLRSKRAIPSQIEARDSSASEATTLLPVDVMTEEAALNGQPNGNKPKSENERLKAEEEGNESDYLKSKLWWLGFLLMNVGECGNFISYAFAPASVVAPLGTFALMANCLFAPLMLGERFRKRDLLGILIAIIGAVTVVLASNASDARLDPEGLLHAISQPPFIAYSCIYVVGAAMLAVLSRGNFGRQWVFVDVGLCALFGGFTVLSTKAVSTLLTMEWLEMFTQWITYPILLVLILTGVGQIRYLNRALMRFDSKVVIPIQFVLFNLSAIVGSAILYGDFKKARFHQIVTFLYGCAATFGGVFIIAWAPNGNDDGYEDEEEGIQSGRDAVRSGVRVETPLSGPGEEGTRLGLGPLGKRRRATLVLPSGVNDTPMLRLRRSAVSLIGLSPAQHLLLVHTPPRELPDRLRNWDVERDPISTPDSFSRRRAVSWFGDDPRSGSEGTHDNSIVGRLRNGGAAGSYDGGSLRDEQNH